MACIAAVAAAPRFVVVRSQPVASLGEGQQHTAILQPQHRWVHRAGPAKIDAGVARWVLNRHHRAVGKSRPAQVVVAVAARSGGRADELGG